MRSITCAAGMALLACCAAAGFAQSRIPCGQVLNQSLPSRSILTIDSKPAGLHIVGTDENVIRVSCSASSDETARAVALHFSPTANGGKLSIGGAHVEHNNNLQVKIEVPRRTSLSVRMFAGEVRVEEVKGDKDIQIGAGQITISSIHAGDYRDVHASVAAGEVKAQAYGADKGGLFRSFSRQNSSGDYRLRAHVTTGEVDLLGNAEQGTGAAKSD